MQRLPKIITGAAAATIVVLAGVAPVALASTANHDHAAQHHAKVSITLSPLRVQVAKSARPQSMHWTLLSNSARPVRITTTTTSFAQNADGNIIITPPIGGPQVSGTGWLKTSPASFVLQPGQRKTVTTTVTVAKHHEPGQRYLGVVFHALSAQPGHSAHSSGASVQAGIAGQLIVNTSGKVVHKTSYGLSAPGFSTGGPVKLTATVRNSGTVYELDNHLVTTGSAHVKFNGVLALAHTSRTESAVWTSPPAFCFGCKIHLAGTSATATVWRLPLWQLLGALAVLAAITFLFFGHRRSLRKAREGVS